ncbi:unnamed protein product [Pieris macdunnoughi]|uniref:Uncharacterized protein n=1 Tax=Pieris macdunnoughi TaxID=345717 RepID=A0A821X189_9NEOP|nr:unnamed protein product [Pieris macdunnoughi]
MRGSGSPRPQRTVPLSPLTPLASSFLRERHPLNLRPTTAQLFEEGMGRYSIKLHACALLPLHTNAFCNGPDAFKVCNLQGRWFKNN